MVTRDAEIEFVSTRVGTQPVEYHELGGFSYSVKGVFDRLVAAAALVLLAIPMALIVLAIKLTSPGPAFIKQERVGRFGRPFYFYKFRSMRVDAEVLRETLEDHNDHDLDVPLIFKMRNDPRVTRIGSFLRRSSLDELPNLFNVLRGEMSIVGPRPPLPREVSHYTAYHMQRLSTVPGMTGLWQVGGRCELAFDQMVELDLEYIRNWSLLGDLGIILRTPLVVLGGKGAW
ncbi:MAG: sugar transferase [Chloroflexi bacterium]|nr:sugar transferase [Chloroflexota bacterium]